MLNITKHQGDEKYLKPIKIAVTNEAVNNVSKKWKLEVSYTAIYVCADTMEKEIIAWFFNTLKIKLPKL